MVGAFRLHALAGGTQEGIGGLGLVGGPRVAGRNIPIFRQLNRLESLSLSCDSALRLRPVRACCSSAMVGVEWLWLGLWSNGDPPRTESIFVAGLVVLIRGGGLRNMSSS